MTSNDETNADKPQQIKKRKETMKLAEKWWSHWCALNSGQYATGSSDWRALDKDYEELAAYGKEHGTLLYALRTLLEREKEWDASFSEITALQRIISALLLNTVSAVLTDSRWTTNSGEFEGLHTPLPGGPVTLTECPKCGFDSFECLHQKTEGRFEEYQETVGCEECGAEFTIHYAMALKAVKVTEVSDR